MDRTGIRRFLIRLSVSPLKLSVRLFKLSLSSSIDQSQWAGSPASALSNSGRRLRMVTTVPPSGRLL